MSKKKNIKSQAKYCLLCGSEFLCWNDKHINKIKDTKRHSRHNSVVLCLECKNYLCSSDVKIYECQIPLYCASKYFKGFDKKTEIEIMKKMKLLKAFKLEDLI